MGLFCLLLASADVHAWEHEPLATDLQPVQPQLVLRHRELMEAVSSGRGASPVYRNAWADMDTRWALVAAGQEPEPLTDAETQAYVTLASMAAQCAGEVLLAELVAESPELRSLAGGLRTLLAPSVSVRQHTDAASGDHTVGVSAGGGKVLTRPELELAAMEDVRATSRTRSRRPAMTAGLASGLRQTPILVEDSLNTQWVLTSYVQARSVGVDNLRLATDVLHVDAQDGVDADWYGLWRLSARERLAPRWVALSSVRSERLDYMPGTVRPALAWQVLPQRSDWYLVGSYQWDLPDALEPDLERTAMVRLSWSSDWVMPTSPDRWPLGRRPGADGPSWPEHGTTLSNELQRPGTQREEESWALAR